MPDYLITPKAPLLFRDGKPFGATEEMAIAETIPFPLPSTIAGAIRTAWAESQDSRYDYANNAEKLIKKRVLGPLLTRTKTNTENPISEVLYPAPADSLCLNEEKSKGKIRKIIVRLYPDNINEKDAGTDLPDKLLPVFLDSESKAKPAKDAPKYWTQDAIISWLKDETQAIDAKQQIAALPIETRTHVGINYQTKSNLKSHLFHTSGLDFSQAQKPRQLQTSSKKEQLGWQEYEYGLLSWFQEEIPETYRTIGGESRLGHIQQQNLWPSCPPELSKAYINSQSFRLILATPAIFNNGYLPAWLDNELKGKLGNMQVQLRAVSIARWQAGTSWDMADSKSKKGKGMRTIKRLAPAGSVYWFDILNEGQGAELTEHWLTSISDEREKDGYGLILPGIWNKSNSSKNIKEST